MPPRLSIVTATLDYARAESCVRSWMTRALAPVDLYVVWQAAGEREWEQIDRTTPDHHRRYGRRTRDILGVVPAFAIGVQKALEDGASIIASLHDDLEILENGWDETVVSLFKACPRAGLCGFGGGKGLGSDDIYKVPYNPMQLARQRFLSNMKDAETHGERCEVATPVACLDGNALIGRREFWAGISQGGMLVPQYNGNLFSWLASHNVRHHAYDSLMGCLAKRLDWQTWFLPVAIHHFGGRTAVGDARYAEWANQQVAGGDATFWQEAHQFFYAECRDVLPLRT